MPADEQVAQAENRGALVPSTDQVKGELQGPLEAAPIPVSTTYNVAKREERLVVLDAMMGAGDNAEAWINREFQIDGIVVHLKEYLPNKQSGEVVQAVWSTIVTTAGDMIHFHSQGILDHLRALMQLSNGEPLPKLGTFVLVRRPLKDGHGIYQLRRVVKDKAKRS